MEEPILAWCASSLRGVRACGCAASLNFELFTVISTEAVSAIVGLLIRCGETGLR